LFPRYSRKIHFGAGEIVQVVRENEAYVRHDLNYLAIQTPHL
jgi:hypothetical protein